MPAKARTLDGSRLLRISTAQSELIRGWKEGVSLRHDSGREVDQLVEDAAVDRWKLARKLHREGNSLLRLRTPPYRSIVGRYYYAMYHAMRAVVYHRHAGDDHHDHTVLHSKVPNDFPDKDLWQNALKNAREYRNQADYEVYPRSGRKWEKHARNLQTESRDLIEACRAYLVGKGVKFDG